MAVITCPKCKKRFDPGVTEEDFPETVTARVPCPACDQWVRLPGGEPAPAPKAPPDIVKALKAKARLVEDGGPGTLVACPDCGCKLRLKAALLPGRRLTCPKCAGTFAPNENTAITSTAPAPANAPVKPRTKPRPEPEEVADDELEELEELEEVPSEKTRRQSRDDVQDDDVDDNRPRPRKKRKKKKSSNAGALVGIGVAVLAALMAAGVVTSVLSTVGPFGGGYAKHQAAARDAINLLNELAAVLESVNDVNSAKVAAQKINQICDRMEAFEKRVRELPRISRSDDERLKKEMEPELQRMMQRMVAAGMKAGMSAQNEPTFMSAAQRLQRVGQSLQRLGR